MNVAIVVLGIGVLLLEVMMFIESKWLVSEVVENILVSAIPGITNLPRLFVELQTRAFLYLV